MQKATQGEAGAGLDAGPARAGHAGLDYTAWPQLHGHSRPVPGLRPAGRLDVYGWPVRLIDGLNTAQRVVIVVAIALALAVVGRYLVSLGSGSGFHIGWY